MIRANGGGGQCTRTRGGEIIRFHPNQWSKQFNFYASLGLFFITVYLFVIIFFCPIATNPVTHIPVMYNNVVYVHGIFDVYAPVTDDVRLCSVWPRTTAVFSSALLRAFLRSLLLFAHRRGPPVTGDALSTDPLSSRNFVPLGAHG